MTDKALDIWTIYQSPKDYPGKFVCRLWRVTRDGEGPTDIGFVEDTLDAVRARLMGKGLCRIPRESADDPVIVESWL
jgi:hypothetical protein